MRRKIAKRLRRECLRLGGEIVEEGWIAEDGEYVKKMRLKMGVSVKEKAYATKVKYNGWTICSADYDELGAYRVALDCMKIDCAEPWEEGKYDEQS